MSKFDSLLQNTNLIISPTDMQEDAVHVILKPAPRLLVLVSGADLDDLDLTRQIWELAKPGGLEVVLLALCNDFDQEAWLRRKLITMAAVIHDETIETDFRIGYGNNWLKLTGQEWRIGDILACGSEQYVSLWGKSLSQTLALKFKAPVYIFSDQPPLSRPMPKMLSTALFWSGSISIIAIFFEMEVKITHLQQDWAHTVLLYLFVFVETGLIWAWSALF